MVVLAVGLDKLCTQQDEVHKAQVEVYRLMLDYIRLLLGYTRLMLGYIRPMLSHIRLSAQTCWAPRALGNHRNSQELSQVSVKGLSKHQYIRLVLLDLLSVADLIPQ